MSDAAPDNLVTPPATGQADPDRQRSVLISTVSWFRDLMLSVLIAVLVILFLYRPVKVEGTSMMPSLYDQERLFINQFSYKFGLGDIKRGDTVVFLYPEDPTKSYIKRVIGLPTIAARGASSRVTTSTDGPCSFSGRLIVSAVSTSLLPPS